MFWTYLLISALAAASVIAVAFTVSFFMELSDMKNAIQNHDTNGANKATVENVIGSSISKAKTVDVGLFKGSERVADVSIECPQGTNVKVGDSVWI